MSLCLMRARTVEGRMIPTNERIYEPKYRGCDVEFAFPFFGAPQYPLIMTSTIAITCRPASCLHSSRRHDRHAGITYRTIDPRSLARFNARQALPSQRALLPHLARLPQSVVRRSHRLRRRAKPPPIARTQRLSVAQSRAFLAL